MNSPSSVSCFKNRNCKLGGFNLDFSHVVLYQKNFNVMLLINLRSHFVGSSLFNISIAFPVPVILLLHFHLYYKVIKGKKNKCVFVWTEMMHCIDGKKTHTQPFLHILSEF